MLIPFFLFLKMKHILSKTNSNKRKIRRKKKQFRIDRMGRLVDMYFSLDAIVRVNERDAIDCYFLFYFFISVLPEAINF